MFFPPDWHHISTGGGRRGQTRTTYASLCSLGMLFSTFLISPALKPVTVRLCLGLEKPGPTGPLSSEIGALVEGLLLLDSLAMFGIEKREEGRREKEEERRENWEYELMNRGVTGEYIYLYISRVEDLESTVERSRPRVQTIDAAGSTKHLLGSGPRGLGGGGAMAGIP